MMNAIKTRWKKLKTWQKIFYIWLSLWLFDLFFSLSTKGKTILGGLFIFFVIMGGLIPKEDTNTLLESKNAISNIDSTLITILPKYNFVEENKQLTGSCSMTEWVYSVPDSINKDEVEGILRKIYDDKKSKTDRVNISLYTKTAIENIKNDITDISIGFLNDGFNCEGTREVKIKNNIELYNSFKTLENTSGE